MADETGNCRKIEETVDEDRISALPEDLLVHILLFVPTKDAVTTTVLSKRWSCIWKMLPKLLYRDTNKEDADKRSVWWFLDESLQLHNAPVLQRLDIKLGSTCPVDADVGRWIDKAVERCIRWLNFDLFWSAEPIILSKSLYTCKTIKSLHLSNKILVDVPSQASLRLLQLLELDSVVYKDEDSLVKLLSSCPVLRFLYVYRNADHDNVTNFSVKVPSLGLLWYQNLNHDDDDVGEIGGSLVIDSPKLKTFKIHDSSGDTCLIENMSPRLNLASVYVVPQPNDKFLRSLSSAISIKLTWIDATDAFCSAIKFSRLTKCKLTPLDSQHWLVSLMLLLHNSPKLKFLRINSVRLCPSSPFFVEPTEFCSEMLEWKKYGGTREEKQLLTYILANTKRLKTVEISPKYTNEEMMEELKSISRVSPSSQLLFSTQFTRGRVK